MAQKISIVTNSTSEDPSIFYKLYKDHKPVGKGGYGKVFEAIEKLPGRKVAIKRVRLKSGTRQNVLAELKILGEVEHHNILRYHTSWHESPEYHQERDEKLFEQPGVDITGGSLEDNDSTQVGNSALEVHGRETNSGRRNRSGALAIDQSVLPTDKMSPSEKEGQKNANQYEYLFIVTTLCKNKSLEHRLLPEYRSINKISRFEALHIFYQIVEGVRYLHEGMNTIHCDLKPANILFSLDATDTVKIADFGLAITQKALVPLDDLNFFPFQKPGTIFYMPPDTELPSFKRDIYALGIILFELLYPFSSDAERIKVLDNLRRPSIKFPDDFETKYGNIILKSLITQLLSHSPHERPTISNLKELIARRLELDDSDENDDGIVPKLECVLTNPSVKQISLATDDIQYGAFDTSDQYLLLSDDKKLKLYDINGQLIDEYSELHQHSQYVGYVQRIVWCEYLQQFFILCQYYLYTFTPGTCPKLRNMQQIHNINKYHSEEEFHHISCTNKHWSHYREWSKKRLNYQEVDEIHRITCSATNDYIALNVRLDKCEWVIDFRRIDNNLTLLKRVEVPDGSIRQKLQLSAYEWLVSTDEHHFCVFNWSKEDSNLKIVQNNIKSESFIYPRFFGNYFLVPIIKIPQNNEFNTQRRGIIHFYQWKL